MASVFSMRQSAAHLDRHDADDWVLDADDRILPPARRSGGKWLAMAICVAMVAGAGALATSGLQLTLPSGLFNFAASDVTLPVVDAVRRPVAKAAAPRPSEPLPQLPTKTVMAAPVAPAATTPEPPVQVHMAYAPPPAALSDPSARDVRPASIDPNDPIQMRAAAAGLHPQLPRHLLARLTATDYRNAGIAIRTAVAETPEGKTFVWPRQLGPDQAGFQVRIIRAIDPVCRRYVVAVIKDGWTTTAPAMETCEAQAAPSRRN